MIIMPRRSVTRFFIPLIDVLLLLFVIFLLMPIVNLEEFEKKSKTAGELSDSVDSLERELERRTREIQKLEDFRESAGELDKLRAEVDKLRQAAQQPLHKRTAIYIIDIDGKSGEISYYDAAQPQQPIVKLTDAKQVAALIDRHQRDAGGRELYYLFLYPRPETAFPTRLQERNYQAWFAKVAHSLKDAP